MRTMRTYWWRGGLPDGRENFGDSLARSVLAHFGFTATWTPGPQADLIVTGSILETAHLGESWSGTVLGAGRMFEHGPLPTLSKARILALRGRLTAKQLNEECPLGDPGLLADLLIEKPECKYPLGVVPHHSDRLTGVLIGKFPGHFIDPLAHDPLDVVREIASCREIVASSLHGLIIADAFRIPRRAVRCDGNIPWGKDYKFNDYASLFGETMEFDRLQSPAPDQLERVKHELISAFKSL